ncbi:peptide deformylase [Helicobacter sp. MIT 00-7814]|uniref:peptide deformylase n=1 Tax=unclassified Helicobacter TaxID=2593540 RepID=UPI000E1E694E|nr:MULTISPECIES: peptide deformylase [unclassified Helicobacter]RDU55247.1 peptide deformylase [Helicobacter sp. MIT 99-10781]RDU56085.1 peptide deformylase [Helicobacter sp. MIT 00-7814]
MILEILKYPNKRLKEKSKPVEVFDSELHTLLDDMYETMIERNGVGLAAIQVGVAKQILVINLPREDNQQYKEDLLEIINPVFLKQEGEIAWNEGCLSVPDFYESTTRFSHISLAYKDRFGNDKLLQAEDFLSVAIQHEIDHLNGVLFVDKLPILKRKKFEKELKKQK